MRTLSDLRAKRQAGELNFERVILETTGMANPAQCARPSSWTTTSPSTTAWTRW